MTHIGRMSGNRIPKYICADCAEKMGGKPYEGHISSYHTDFCDRCEEHTLIAHKNNWYFKDEQKQTYDD